jgi:hypothetical protein
MVRVFFLIVVAILIVALAGLEVASSRAVTYDGQPLGAIETAPTFWR